MKRKQQLFRLGLIALLGSTSQLSFAQQQPANTVQRTSVPAGQQANPQQANPQQANPQQVAPAPAAGVGGPPFAPLSPEHQKYLDQVLDYWSQQTESIERYRCDFKRWTYEGAEQHERYASGVLRFKKPDQGMFKVEDLFFHKGQNPDGSWNYVKVTGQFGEWWICDGKVLHEFDRTEKKVTRYHLPPEMQGMAVMNSPLPFLFGVKSADAKARYWLRPVAPPNGPNGKPQDVIVIEAFPKKLIDAQNYSKVKVYLDHKEFLPLSLEIFMPNWTGQNNSKEVFEFANREKNWTFLDKAKSLLFDEEFLPLNPPKDWTIEDAPAVEEQPGNTAQQPAPAQPKR